jgi:RNA polymerase sigma factor (sigma-70 family)
VGDNPVVADLVTRASNGDKQAWDALVERYSPLIWHICRRHRLGDADAEDIGQSVWLHLVEQLDRVRDPAALPAWLATTTRRECLLVLRTTQGRLTDGSVLDADLLPDEHAGTAEQQVLVAERHAALREALLHLPPGCQHLIAQLTADPPVPYAEISAKLNIPIGSIGPSRSRCLDRLRRCPAIAALINAGTSTQDEMHGPAMTISGRPATSQALGNSGQLRAGVCRDLPAGQSSSGAVSSSQRTHRVPGRQLPSADDHVAHN